MNNRITIVESVQGCTEILVATKAASTVRMYRIGLMKFANSVLIQGLKYVDELVMSQFIALVGELATTGLAPRSRRVYISALSYYMNWLTAMGHWNPSTQDLERYKLAVQQWAGKARAATKMVKPEEIEKIITFAIQACEYFDNTIIDFRNAAIVTFLYSSGCRVSELVSLKISDINPIERTAIVIGKGNKSRTLYFSKGAGYWLAAYWKFRMFQNSKDPAIGRHDPQVVALPLSAAGIRRVIKQLAEAIGFEKGYITPHSFRHAFAIKMLGATGNLALVQDLLGHSSPETTRVYARFTQETIAQEYANVWNT